MKAGEKRDQQIQATLAQRRQEAERKISFVKKFFPAMSESPGGTSRLLGRPGKTRPVTPVRGAGKIDRKKVTATQTPATIFSCEKRKTPGIYPSFTKKSKTLKGVVRKNNFFEGTENTFIMSANYNPGLGDSVGPNSKTAAGLTGQQEVKTVF